MQYRKEYMPVPSALPAGTFIMAADLQLGRVTPFGTSRRLKAPRESIADDAVHWAGKMAHVASTRDRECFMQIYDHFAPRVQRFLMGRGIPSDKAEDLMQEALLRVWHSAKQFDATRATLSTWLFRIARNLHIDSIRSQQRSPAVDDDRDPMECQHHTADGAGPEAHADQICLNRAIDELPGKQARLIRMAYLESKSHSEIARELDMPLGTVKSIVRRSFEKLQIALRQKP